MAVLISRATGNFTAAATWGVVDATSYNNSESTTTALTTSYQASTGSTTGVITVDGVALKLSVRTGVTGTMSVHLAIAGVEVPGTLVTINVADLPVAAAADLNGGWHFFKFAAPVALVGATSYTVEAKTSSSSQVSLYSTATTNWARALSTTTTQTPVAGDDLIICGEYTGAGTSNSFTVTMNETATTDYGSAPTAANGLVGPGAAICNKGILQYGVTSAVNYYLKMSNSIVIYSGGTFNIGTTGSPMPRDATGVLEFDPGADGDYGLLCRNLGTLNIQGLSRTSGKNVVSCKLNTDEAVASTSLGVDTDTGWLDNDAIVVASTTRTPGQTEKGAMNGNANAADLTVDGFAGAGGGLANAHGGGGTAGVIADLILLTRNIQVRSATSTLMYYLFATATATVDIDWAEFYYLGDDVANKRGIDIATTTGSFSMQFSSIHDSEDYGIYVEGAVTSGSVTVSNNVMYNLNTSIASNTSALRVTGTGANITISNNVALGLQLPNSTGHQSGAFAITATFTGTLSNNTVAGCTSASTSNTAFTFATINVNNPSGVIGNIAYSNGCVGLYLGNSPSIYVNIGSFTAWRNASQGITSGANSSQQMGALAINGGTLFGNTTANINFSCWFENLLFRNMTIRSDATFTTATGFLMNTNSTGGGKVLFANCDFSSTVAHTTDINTAASIAQSVVECYNCNFAAATEFASQTSMNGGSKFSSGKHDQSATTHKALYRYGTIASDQTTRHTASGYSWKLTPNNASRKLCLPGPFEIDTFKAAVNASSLVTITAYVQKDGSYNGNAPRLVLFGSVIGGITADVIASLTVGANTWELLTVTGTPNEAGVAEYYFDCDGTAGNIYVDDIAITQA